MSILDHIGKTPLVRLERIDSRVFGKCEFLNPGGSVKDRLAVAIVDDAERRGVLRRGDTIVEATAGNTGVGLALVAAIRGYRLFCVLPEKMSHDKRTALAQLGARVVMTRNAPPDDPDHFQQLARRLAHENGWFLADQFQNPANVRVHEETTGPEVLEQCPEVAAFVAGVGTGGTITGVGRFLKRKRPGVRIVLADPVGSRLAGWVRKRELGPDGAYAVEGIGASAVPLVFDASVVDEVEEVSDAESFSMVKRLVREEGLLAGGSSGTAVVAALRVARRVEGPVVVVLPDAWDRYRSKPWMQGWDDAATT